MLSSRPEKPATCAAWPSSGARRHDGRGRQQTYRARARNRKPQDRPANPHATRASQYSAIFAKRTFVGLDRMKECPFGSRRRGPIPRLSVRRSRATISPCANQIAFRPPASWPSSPGAKRLPVHVRRRSRRLPTRSISTESGTRPFRRPTDPAKARDHAPPDAPSQRSPTKTLAASVSPLVPRT